MIRVINGHVTLVMANRQLVFGIVMLVLLMWVFAFTTFMVSKVAFPSSVAAVEEPEEMVIYVDSPLLSSGASEARVTPLTKPATDFNPTYVIDTQPGGIYLQVATTDSTVAGAYAEYLTRKSIPAFTSAGPNGEKSMLMVGPAKDKAHLSQLRGELISAGVELN
jgi:hypothetical protein